MTELIRSLRSGQRPRLRAFVAPLVTLFAIATIALSVRAAARTDFAGEARTVVLVARGMTFYVEGRPEPNPRLVVGRGEAVRFVLRNDDPGMGHDLTLPTLGQRSQLLSGAGTDTEIAVRMPKEPGEHPYLCSLHARSMVGVLEVR
ncbi:MAG TPA: hypothetical protein VGC00_10615 [Thermoanaerobaculia bacterium]|jgi:plastocyanin